MVAPASREKSVEELTQQLELTQITLRRTREVNTRLWHQMNGQEVLEINDGELSLRDAEARIAQLSSEALRLNKQLTEQDKRLSHLSQENRELWKRVDFAESRFSELTPRRLVRAALRRLGLLAPLQRLRARVQSIRS